MTIRVAWATKIDVDRIPVDQRKLLAYVHSGAPVTAARTRDVDVEDPARGKVVPIAWRTDGEWMWYLGDAYYVEHHGYAFDDDFLAHVVASDYVPPAHVDRAVIKEAFAWLAAQG